ncbi:branched-chain amino acid ABC transporter permease [Halomarina litorea]|uniref:branched-chain amino acid ABC transporter permease n=1 Tax=Halomarina litorea TaxID=2961595 RepID=UPI0020C3B4A9|nr:branched-chain amino acid ABC transporter permease [Halomarina sp. BCD28]
MKAQISEAKVALLDRLPSEVITVFPLAVAVALVAIGPLLAPHQLSILNQILILGIFGMAYDLLFGYTGLMSFGHAAFFGGGTYTAVYLTAEFGLPLLVIIAAAIVLGAVLASLIGIVSLQTTGVYFSMITLAMAQLLYILTVRLGDSLGGASGLSIFDRPTTLLPIDLGDQFQFFVVTVVILLVTYLVLQRVLKSPVGDVFRAIRENEERAEMLGYNTFYYKLAALTLSGSVSAVAGVLYGLFLYFASPTFLNWTMSGDVLLQTLFGGAGTLFGPVVGAGFVVLLDEFLSPITDQWRLMVGAAFVLVVLFFPEGIVGLLTSDDRE